MTLDIGQLLSDIDALLDLYRHLVDTGTIPDLDITDVVRTTEEEANLWMPL